MLQFHISMMVASMDAVQRRESAVSLSASVPLGQQLLVGAGVRVSHDLCHLPWLEPLAFLAVQWVQGCV
jgi:hypothetical protein